MFARVEILLAVAAVVCDMLFLLPFLPFFLPFDTTHLLIQGHFMYVSNLDEFGHLLNADNYETNHLHNDMYQLFDNKVVS